MAEMQSFGNVLRSPAEASSLTTTDVTQEATVTSGGRKGLQPAFHTTAARAERGSKTCMRTMSALSSVLSGGGLNERAIGRKCNRKICGRQQRQAAIGTRQTAHCSMGE